MDWEWNRSFAQTPTAYWLNIGQKGLGGGGGGGGVVLVVFVKNGLSFSISY